jgi:hypothetical protein
MINSAKVNLAIFNARSFDSGSLTQMLSVVHQFERPGRYEAVVRRGGVAVGRTEFEVSDDGGEMQLTIDLASVGRRSTVREPDCECDAVSARNSTPVVSTKGYVLFTVLSGDGGFSVVVVGKKEKGDPAFDSERLKKGDLFALTLLEPAAYSVVNKCGSAKGEIEVSFRPEDARRLRDLDTVFVGAGKDRFDPARISLTSTQGLVFRVQDVARIVIERGAPSHSDDKDAPYGSVRFRKAPLPVRKRV